MYIDMILMGAGILMFLNGIEGWFWALGIGALLHFSTGGFSTGF